VRKFLILILFLLVSCAHQGKLSKVCFEGDTYFNYQNKLTFKIDDLGGPVKCICENCERNFAKNMDIETKELVDSALTWLKPLDIGNAQKNWDLASYKFKIHMSRKEWANKQRTQFRVLGKIKSRRPFTAYIRGSRAAVSFNADYEQESHARDTVHMVKESGNWKGIAFITR